MWAGVVCSVGDGIVASVILPTPPPRPRSPSQLTSHSMGRLLPRALWKDPMLLKVKWDKGGDDSRNLGKHKAS